MRDKYYNYFLMLVLLLAVFLWLYRFYPYLYSDIPLWYDPGLYRAMFLDYINTLPYIDFSSFSVRTRDAYPPFLWILWNTLYITWFDIDFLLTFWLAGFSIITSIYIYLLLKKYWKIYAFHGMILYFLSIIQYESFYMNYYKQILWVIFILASLYILEKKKYILSIPIIISLFTIHRPSWLFFLIIVVLHYLLSFIIQIFSKNHTNKVSIKGKKANPQINIVFAKAKLYFKNTYKTIYTVLFAWIVSLLMYIPLFQELIWWLIKPLTTTIMVSGTSGTFFSLEDFLFFDFLAILLSIYWLYLKYRQKQFDYITIWFLVWLIWTVFRLFFYNRFLIFFDIFIILIAAYWLWHLYQYKKKTYLFIFILFFWLQSYNYITYIREYSESFISKTDLATIKQLDTLLPADSLLMTSDKHYGPWLFWYTHMSIISPWFTNYNIWDKSQWDRWWDNDWKTKCEMLKDYQKYNKPLYIRIWSKDDEDWTRWTCFEEVYKKDGVRVMRME